MSQDKKDHKDHIKGFWSRLMASLDKKMEEKAKAGSSCCPGQCKDKKC